jgi:hypothetical protein
MEPAQAAKSSVLRRLCELMVRLTSHVAPTRFSIGRTAREFPASLSVWRFLFMLRSASRLFCPVFAAFFGCISLLGQGLHVLVEHPPHAGGSAPCACAAAFSSCADRGHTHRGCGHGQAEPAAVAGAPSAEVAESTGLKLIAETSHDPHECPICGFFAQAQWAVDFQPERVAVAIEPVAEPIACSRPASTVGVYQSRGPPSGAAIL